jgi:hypothetical protein
VRVSASGYCSAISRHRFRHLIDRAVDVCKLCQAEVVEYGCSNLRSLLWPTMVDRSCAAHTIWTALTANAEHSPPDLQIAMSLLSAPRVVAPSFTRYRSPTIERPGHTVRTDEPRDRMAALGLERRSPRGEREGVLSPNDGNLRSRCRNGVIVRAGDLRSGHGRDERGVEAP